MNPNRYLQGLNPQQKKAAQHLHGPLLVFAGAGSGKTKVITHRICYMIENQIFVSIQNRKKGVSYEKLSTVILEI